MDSPLNEWHRSAYKFIIIKANVSEVSYTRRTICIKPNCNKFKN